MGALDNNLTFKLYNRSIEPIPIIIIVKKNWLFSFIFIFYYCSNNYLHLILLYR